MAKRKKKQKAGKQQPRTRKQAQGSGSSAGASGTMGGFRKGLQVIAGTGGKKKAPSTLDRVVNLALWGAVVVAAIFAYRRCA